MDETLARLEAELEQASVPPERKRELVRLIAALRAEMGPLGGAQPDVAKSIAGFTQTAVHEATRSKRRPELLELSLAGLEKSVAEFESSHPRLVEIVGALSAILSNIGL